MKKWICEETCGFNIYTVYPEDPQRTLEEIISPPDRFDENVTLNSEILIEEHEGYFHILIDNRYNMDLAKKILVCVQTENITM